MRIMIGRWDQAEESLIRAIESSKTVGDLKSYEEAAIALGSIYFFKGEVRRSVSTVEDALQSAHRRGDAQTQELALNAQARNYYILGDFKKCLSLLEDVRVVFESAGAQDHVAEINYYALDALVHFRNREIQQCWILGETVYNLIKECEPTSYFAYFGYAFLTETYVRLLCEPKHWTEDEFTLTKAKVQSRAKKCAEYLSKFAKVFTIAQPRNLLWQGALEHSNGKGKQASTLWASAADSAKSLSMQYEHAFVLYQSAVLTKNAADITLATQLFPEIKTISTDFSVIKGLKMRGKNCHHPNSPDIKHAGHTHAQEDGAGTGSRSHSQLLDEDAAAGEEKQDKSKGSMDRPRSTPASPQTTKKREGGEVKSGKQEEGKSIEDGEKEKAKEKERPASATNSPGSPRRELAVREL